MKNIELKLDHYTAIIKSKGAELISFKNKHIEAIWTPDERYWTRTSPVLFPIVGKLKDDVYTYNNKTYQMNRHGFARTLDFNCFYQTTSEAFFSLKSTKETLTIYPFDFELQIHYFLTLEGLKIKYLVFNNDSKTMPFSIGGHPAFNLDKPFHEYTLTFSEPDDVLITHLLENELFSGETKEIKHQKGMLSLDYSLFENDALVFKNLKSKSITINKNTNPFITVQFDNFPFLGIWTKNKAPFICIEPWLGHADDSQSKGKINEKEGIIFLESNTSFESEFTITLF